MAADALQRIFKTLADPTRVRILALLEREELAVQELMEALGMAQSRVSRHLAILREAGLVQDRRDGTFVFYRFAPPAAGGAWAETWSLVRASLAGDSTHERDAAALSRVLAERAARTQRFFESVGPEWDALRKVFHDDLLRARAVAQLVDPQLVVVDFLHHQHEWMRQELGVSWLGFSPEEVTAWYGDAGLAGFRLETEPAPAGGRDLPATFIASGRRPR
jgi:DNA-binding transcriptional ArsR family regulator